MAHGESEPRHHLVVVLDGLRPEYITPDVMPNLHALGQEGIVAENHHVVFPPVTRVNSSSLATGAHPGTHGLMHNQLYLPEISDGPIDTGNDVDLMIQAEPLLTATSIGEWLDEHGLTLFAASSGSHGTTFLLNHTIAGHGVWNSRGLILPDEMREEALETLGELPELTRPNYEQNRWVVDTYHTFALDRYTTDVAVLWITDPDRTAHEYGIGAPETLTALRHVDEELGRILGGLDERDLLDHTNVFVTTDHGFSTHTGGFDLEGTLEENNLLEGVRIIGNVQIYVENQEEGRMRQIVRVLQEAPSVGAIFTRPAEESSVDGWIEGTLSLDLIHHHHERAADILATAAWTNEANELDYPGSSTQDGTAGHGTTSPYELQATLIAAGPDLKTSSMSSVPSGNVDIAATILHLLDLPLPETMDGRALEELLVDGPNPDAVEFEVERHETGPITWNSAYNMILDRARVGEASYFREARINR